MKVKELARIIGTETVGNGEIEIDSISEISAAGPSSLAFYEKSDPLPETSAGCLIIGSSAQLPTQVAENKAFIIAENPKLAFALAASILLPKEKPFTGISPFASIAESAEIGDNVAIAPFVTIEPGSKIGSGSIIYPGTYVGRGVAIGEDCTIHPNVSISAAAEIGNRVILHSGVVIGADGFGFVRGADGRYTKFPQIGSVVIGDDVEIGANTCIDRGALGNTFIGAGTKIDNLVQIGHNVRIGCRCVIAAETGISGSVVIEDDCVIGGQVGFGDHVYVQRGAVIGSQAGVLPGKIVRPGVWWGTPIRPLDEYKRLNAHINGIERLKEDVRQLKERLSELLARIDQED